MSTKVYVVVEQDLEWCLPRGVFTTLEQAKQHRNAMKNKLGCCIFEYLLNAYCEDPNEVTDE